ncbi:hypothetical protein CLV47_10739 [Antricoccus suffuscus]|uniref:Uncharacterized protein n=1 Tax=Antricoccus suffuscus TaxID=1629062 RepID=A0A2T0ZZY1_9ACTN|nr:hypothetical protein [Antricoccus suffuscus]PRZ41913.1 hypothetical protein CLV47_10739 [Antricoccus suffuscus]
MTPTDESALYVAFMGHADATAERLVGLHARLLAGELSREQFIALAAALVGRAQAQAYALADLSLAAWVTAQTGTAAPTLGLLASVNVDRLRDGLTTLISVVDHDEPGPRVARYGRAETAGAFQDAYSDGMRSRPEVGGYTRRLNVAACELCHWLYRDGYVWAASKPFHRHPGCGCHPEPVLAL